MYRNEIKGVYFGCYPLQKEGGGGNVGKAEGWPQTFFQNSIK